MPAIRDLEYAAVVERERPLAQATAYLLTGDPVQAERVVQLVFADLYGHSLTHLRLEALRAVVHTARAAVHLPWEHLERFELIDGLPPVTATEQIVADLQALTYDQRAAIVLESYAGLTVAQVAEVLKRPASDVLSIAGRGRNMLAAGHPERMSDEALLQQLRDAIPYDLREPHGSADDVAHGRRLARRRWIQRGSAALAAVVLILVAVVLIDARHLPVPQAAPAAPIPTPSGYNCDPSNATCRAHVLFKWRFRMIQVASSYLDPSRKYFNAFSYSNDSHYDMPSFWTGQGGALAIEMFRFEKGATEVYIQIASSRKFAVRCGATTGQKCIFLRFMDGNSYLLTDSTLADRGIEVQYSPKGDEVITIIARDTQRGRGLEISIGDLIKLVQDEQLRLPKRCCYRR